MSKRQIRRLVKDIYKKGESSEEGLAAIKTLATMGEPALREMISSMAHPPKSDLHPIDLWESIHRVFWEFARVIPDCVMDLMDEGTLSPAYGYSALGGARGLRSIDVLIAGLKHKAPVVRWIAAEALIHRGVKATVPALLAALRDRSDSVKWAVVLAMQSQAHVPPSAGHSGPAANRGKRENSEVQPRCLEGRRRSRQPDQIGDVIGPQPAAGATLPAMRREFCQSSAGPRPPRRPAPARRRRRPRPPLSRCG